MPAEAKVIEARHGSLPAPLADLTCDKLIDGKCSIYEDRPFICRVFGAVKSERMRCPHGCKPKDGFLNKRRSDKIIVKINKIDE